MLNQSIDLLFYGIGPRECEGVFESTHIWASPTSKYFAGGGAALVVVVHHEASCGRTPPPLLL